MRHGGGTDERGFASCVWTVSLQSVFYAEMNEVHGQTTSACGDLQ